MAKQTRRPKELDDVDRSCRYEGRLGPHLVSPETGRCLKCGEQIGTPETDGDPE